MFFFFTEKKLINQGYSVAQVTNKQFQGNWK